MIEADIVIIGGGIAGASAAAHLAAERSVVLLEREGQPGYHASGRSAALFSETYGNAAVRALSVASRSFLAAPPEGFAEHPLLASRGAMHVGTAGDEERLAGMADEISALVPSVRRLDAGAARALVPPLKADWVTCAVLEPDAMDIDTNGLLQGFLRLFRARGGRVVTDAEVTAIGRDGSGWLVVTSAGEARAQTLVNAAGAWADEIAQMAGLRPIGLVPKRRTAFLFEPPTGIDVRGWPIVVGAAEDFYVKPDAGLLLGSPADETPSAPTDAAPEDLDIAVAVERIQNVADLPVRRIVRKWAGLRTFADDKTPVVGFDPNAEGFFWLAGQGGYGFQTAPALGHTAARLLLAGEVPGDVRDLAVTSETLSPARFTTLRDPA